MVQIIWSERAIIDLNSIAEYIASDSEYAANKFVQELINKTNTLLSYPKMGRPILKIYLVVTDRFFIRATDYL